MSPLQSAFNRLYLATEPIRQNGHTQAPVGGAADGGVRAMVLELAKPADWDALGAVWRGVQVDLDLPAPAIAVSGIDGHQLWFSLAEAVSAADARAFLEALRVRYLGAVDPKRIRMLPGCDAHAVPALQAENGRWSAFVSADLAGIFTDEPWLDLEPTPDAQIRLLSRLECIQPAAFQAVLKQTQPAAAAATSAVAPDTVAVPQPDDWVAPSALATHANPLGPKRFLSDVMNDPTVPLPLRIEAAKALLPYVEAASGNLR